MRVRPVTMRFAPGLMAFVSYDVFGFAPDFVPAAAAHRGETDGAQLGVLGLHAGGDLRHVGNEFRAQPHGIGRAGLLDVLADRGIGAVGLIERRGRKQRQQTDKTHDPHGHFPT